MILKNKSRKIQFKKIRDEQQNIIQLCHVDDDVIFGQGNQVQTEPELIQIPDFSKQAGVKLRDSIGPQDINIQSADNYFIPFISERDRMGNLITSKINKSQNKTQEKTNGINNQYFEGKDVKYSNEKKVKNNQIVQQQETIAVQSNMDNILSPDQKNQFNEIQQQNLFQRDKSEHNLENQKDLKSTNEQQNFDAKYYKKRSFQAQGRKIRKNMNINQINQGKITLTPNSLLANLKTNNTLKNTDISKDSSFNLSKIEIDDDKQLKPSLDDNDNWGINYYVSDKALIQGSNRKQIQMYLKTKNMRLESRNKMKSNQAFLTPTIPPSYLLQHDLKKRQTQDQMLIEWNEKIQQYGYKFDRKGLKKFFGDQIAVKINK
ncbi:hypothetical protein PPERSA_03524 [Pseudocohnilembus persalinus]|uniref:Uncharacterized protein n=1 Tax=Pseudocohnilembus persalinus TaxID=266149 RepID=A0A0V0R2N0_PSEPJ|nr:hypothetical protein PPERSA_03524 [Pseudocohnilembus persalinus]|eukprot:KRX08653.1 hypothetical protein PPERSA_03524 [Pseudocohnilembus persalinus]